MNKKISKTIILTASLLGSIFALADTPPTKELRPNNSGVNKRDVNENTTNRQSVNITAQDQSKGTKSDVELTRKIRSRITNDSTLSTDARNVKIITLDGVVTLRGPVINQREKTAVANCAAMVVNKNNVRNELEIVSSDQNAR